MSGRFTFKRAKSGGGGQAKQEQPQRSLCSPPRGSFAGPSMQLACTTGPTLLRSVLPRKTAIVELTPPPPLFTFAPLVHLSSQTLRARERNVAAELENLEFPLSLDDDYEEPTPCQSILTTPIFPGQSSSDIPPSSLYMQDNTSNYFSYGYQAYHGYHYSNAPKSYGSRSCECEVECIDPSLCSRSYVSFGSSFARHVDVMSSIQYREPSPEPTGLEGASEGTGCSWAASPPPDSAMPSGTPSLSSHNPTFAWGARRTSVSSLSSNEHFEDDGDEGERASDGFVTSRPLAELLNGCGSLIDSEYQPTPPTRPSAEALSFSTTDLSACTSPVDAVNCKSNDKTSAGLIVESLDFAHSPIPAMNSARKHVLSCLTASAPPSILNKRLSPIREL